MESGAGLFRQLSDATLDRCHLIGESRVHLIANNEKTTAKCTWSQWHRHSATVRKQVRDACVGTLEILVRLEQLLRLRAPPLAKDMRLIAEHIQSLHHFTQELIGGTLRPRHLL